MERCSALSAIREMQIDTTIGYLLEWLKYKTVTTPNAGKDVEKTNPSYIAGGPVK